MGTIVPRLPPAREQYEAGLKEGRDLYAEDLAQFERSAFRLRLAVFALAVFAGVAFGLIISMIVLT